MAASSWHDIPLDLFLPISERLSECDRARFGAVCKNWRQGFLAKVQLVVGNSSYVPWVVTYGFFRNGGEPSCVLELSDLLTERTYSIGKNVSEDVRDLFLGAKVSASKHGWLLLSKKEVTPYGGSVEINFFFYNPFGNKVIPVSSPLILNADDYFEYYFWDHLAATFTTAPTNRQDCVIFVIARVPDDVCVISMCKLSRDTAWISIYDSSNSTSTVNHPCSVFDVDKLAGLAYWEGMLFCTAINETEDYLIGAFNVALGVWEMVGCHSDILEPSRRLRGWYWSWYNLHLVQESDDGNFYLLACRPRNCRYRSHDENQRHMSSRHAFQFDHGSHYWVEVETLEENRVLFLGNRSSSAIATHVPPLLEKSTRAAFEDFPEVYHDDLFRRLLGFKINNLDDIILRAWAGHKNYLSTALVRLCVPEEAADRIQTRADSKEKLERKQEGIRKEKWRIGGSGGWPLWVRVIVSWWVLSVLFVYPLFGLVMM